MHLGVTPDPTLPCVHLPTLVLPETAPVITRRALPARRSYPTADHDAMLLVGALEEIEARRAALEWLLDRDLLRACLD